MNNKLFEALKKALETQAALFTANEIESLKGPEPSGTDGKMGAAETRSIKKASRHPYGAMIVETLTNASTIMSIRDDTNEEGFIWSWWLDNRMPHKFKVLLRDHYVGGSGFLELYLDDEGKVNASVHSPKRITTVSRDRVNNEFNDYAIEAFNDGGVTKYKVWDNTKEYILTRNGQKRIFEVETERVHGFPVVPVFNVDDIITSDGSVYSEMELIQPLLETMRVVTNATTSGTYWQGLKQLIIENIDKSAYRVDPETGEQINLYEEVQDELKMDAQDFIALPAADDIGGAAPRVAQTQEANISQLTHIIKETKNTLSALTSIPLHRFDPDATPQNAEGAVQAYQALKDKKDGKQAAIGERLKSIFTVVAAVSKQQYSNRYEIFWAANDQTSLNSLADTVVKMTSAGIPLEWVVGNIIAKSGFTPDKIANLHEAIQAKMARQSAFDSALLSGVNPV